MATTEILIALLRVTMLDIGAQFKRMLMQEAAASSAKEQSLLEWAHRFCPEFLFRGISERFHRPLCDTYDTLKEGDKTLIIVPRGNAKTTWTQLMVLRAICERTEPYIILVSDSSDQAEKILSAIKNILMENERIKQVYGDVIQPGPIWSMAQIITKGGVSVDAVGKGKKIRGRRYKQWRPTLIILDDPQNEADAESPSQMEKDWRWFVAALTYAGDDYTKFVVIGTMLDKRCIVGQCEKLPSFTTFRYKAVIKWPRRMEYWNEWKELYLSSPVIDQEGKRIRDDSASKTFYALNRELMDEGAEVLWQEKESLYELMCMWSENPASFMAEKQNEPFDPSKSEFSYEWFAESRTSVWYDDVAEFERQEHFSVGFIDWAHGKETKRGDYTAKIVLHFTGTCCYVEADINKIPVTQAVEDVVQWHKIVNFALFGCEAQGFQKLANSDIVDACEEQDVDPSFLVPIENGNTPKKVRIARLSTYLKRGFYKFRRNCPHTTLLIDQLLSFPNPREHDDGPDALEGATRVLYMVLSDSGMTGMGTSSDEIIGKIS